MSRIPECFYAGDTVTWIEDSIPADATAATFHIRSSVGRGVTLSGSKTADGWLFTLLGTVTEQFAANAKWWGQPVAVVDGYGQARAIVEFDVLPGLALLADDAVADLRGETSKRLDEVEAAIHALATGAQEYRVGFGNQGRTVRRPDLPELIAWRDRLRAQVAAEARAASSDAGVRDRGVYVRFT